MSDLPNPLVPAEVDLRDFQYMELDVRRLRDSRFGAEVTGDAFRAGVLLWCAAWHQVPCGSVPDDDIELANLAGYGRFVKEWRKEREQALQGFIKCSDGRLYHETVCEKARSAWQARLDHFYDKAKDRLRKANKARSLESPPRPPLPELPFDQWNQNRLSGGIPMEKAEAFQGIPPIQGDTNPGIPPENALKGNGEGTERERNGEKEEKGSGGSGKKKPAAKTVVAEKTPSILMKTWIGQLKAAQEKPFPDDDPVFAYAAKVGLSRDFLHLAWLVFKKRYTGEGVTKKYKDWRRVFRNAVQDNWLGLWWLDGSTYELTTRGKQAKLEFVDE